MECFQLVYVWFSLVIKHSKYIYAYTLHLFDMNHFHDIDTSFWSRNLVKSRKLNLTYKINLDDLMKFLVMISSLHDSWCISRRLCRVTVLQYLKYYEKLMSAKPYSYYALLRHEIFM